MSSDLVATVLPKLDSYSREVDHADARALASAAFKARYCGDLGDTIGQQARKLLYDRDEQVIDLIAADTAALDAIRTAAKAAARFIERNPLHSRIYDASEAGGPDVLVVGGEDWGFDGPFDGFDQVKVLAALLAHSWAGSAQANLK